MLTRLTSRLLCGWFFLFFLGGGAIAKQYHLSLIKSVFVCFHPSVCTALLHGGYVESSHSSHHRESYGWLGAGVIELGRGGGRMRI